MVIPVNTPFPNSYIYNTGDTNIGPVLVANTVVTNPCRLVDTADCHPVQLRWQLVEDLIMIPNLIYRHGFKDFSA